MMTYVHSHATAVREMFAHLKRHRLLLWEMARRDVADRYAGQMFGSLWAIGHPLALMGVYIVVFAYIFRLKVGGTVDMPLDYTVYLLAGLIPWLTFQEAMSRGVNAVTGNAGLVKQVVFPLEVLPLKGILAALFSQLVASLILVAYVVVTSGSLPWTFVLLPLLWVLQFMAMGGVCFLLAAAGTYFRDLKDLVQIFTMIGMYLMPTFYLPAWVPSGLRPILYCNPFSYMIWCFQDVCYFGRLEHPWAWPIFGCGAVLTFYLGYRAFKRLKHYFGSIL
jgi:homopolymeric O-antigen transport system permease protein